MGYMLDADTGAFTGLHPSSPCANILQAIVDSLYEPVIESVVDEIAHADDNVLPGLPYPEIPVVCLTSESQLPLSSNPSSRHFSTSPTETEVLQIAQAPRLLYLSSAHGRRSRALPSST